MNRRIIKIYLLACLVFAMLGIVGSLIFFLFSTSSKEDSSIMGTKFAYFLNEYGKAEPAIIVFKKEIASKLDDWYRSREIHVNHTLPFKGDEFYTIPVNTEVEILSYYNDSTIVQVRYRLPGGGRLKQELEGFVVNDVLHEDPLNSR